MSKHRSADARAAQSELLGVSAREIKEKEEARFPPIKRKGDRRIKPKRWIMRRLWLRYVGEGPQRVRAIVRDGHVFYPCGCMWNLAQQRYSVRCNRDDHRDVTPPHEDACLPQISQAATPVLSAEEPHDDAPTT